MLCNDAAVNGSLAKNKIMVIGDIMLDQHIIGKTKNYEHRTPVTIITNYEDRYYLAGAAKTASIIKRMGIKVLLAGIVGMDEEGDIIKKMLKTEDIPLVLGMLSTRPTTVKRTIGTCCEPFVRIENGFLLDIKSVIFQEILKIITVLSDDLKLITICDYSRGVVTEELVSVITEICRLKDIKVVAALKGTGLKKFAGSDIVIIEMNTLEQLQKKTLNSLKELEAAACMVFDATGCGSCIITWGYNGAFLFCSTDEWLHIPLKLTGLPLLEYDAGETFTAALSAALSRDLNIEESLRAACDMTFSA